MSIVKYRLKEVAADFGLPTKEVTEVISKFFEKPKSTTQVLTEDELNVVFDYITQTHQIDSLEVVFAVQPAPKVEAPKEEKPVETKQEQKPVAQQPKAEQKPAAAQQPKAEQKPAKPAEPERRRERRVVDTSAVQVNTRRFDDVDNLVSERVQNYQGGKQKFGKKGQQQNSKKDNKFKGNKARNEEQEKMRRLQMEVARKAPVTVKIGDEITVGELASRMKKTAGEVIKCLMKNGVMAGINQTIDFDTAEFVAVEMGCKVEREITVTKSDRSHVVL